jgi:signal peptidase II
MEAKKIIRTVFIIVVLVSNIGCDQFSKKIARQHIAYHEEITVIPDFLTLTKVENPGAFLSMGGSLPKPVRALLLSVLPALVLAATMFFVFTRADLTRRAIIGICFVVGGGIGNIYDRVVYGSVTDFLHMDFILFQTGIFNMADVSILVGMFIVVFDSVIRQKSVIT